MCSKALRSMRLTSEIHIGEDGRACVDVESFWRKKSCEQNKVVDVGL